MKHKNIILSLVMAAFFFVMAMFSWFKPSEAFSESERRKLAQFPEFNVKTVLSGKFMKGFEDYSLDQFPMRDKFRALKANFALKVLGRSSNNDIYIYEDHVAKMDYPLNMDSVNRAGQRFNYIYNKYLKDSGAKTYLSLIPDKNYFMAEKSGMLFYDYEAMENALLNSCGFAEYIDIKNLLSLEDYYKTDAHWSQDKILSVAEELLNKMDAKAELQYETLSLPVDFYGVYYGQSALKLKPDTISYLYNPRMDEYEVYDFQNGKEIPLYSTEKAEGRDGYEFFLSGPLSLVEIKNPHGEKGRELVIFRDSFGSSIAPLLAQGYEKVTLADIRYAHPDILCKNINFNNADVLFLYSDGVINNSETLK